MPLLETRMIMATRSFLMTVGAGIVAAVSVTASSQQPAAPLGALTLPAGFRAEVFAANVENAREMVLGPGGTVFVGSRTAGKVHAIVDRDGDHKADRVVVIASGLDQPNGVVVRNGALYVATASRLLRYDDIEKHLDAPPAPVTLRDEMNVAPKAGLHFGFPYCHQGDVTDPQFGTERACATTEPPVQKLGAHVAAIGFTFYTGSMFPADVLQMPDGSILISDDAGNRLVRVSYAQ